MTTNVPLHTAMPLPFPFPIPTTRMLRRLIHKRNARCIHVDHTVRCAQHVDYRYRPSMPRKEDFMTTDEPQMQVLTDLANMVSVQTEATVSRTVMHTEGGNVVLFSFDAGQQLSEHTARRVDAQSGPVRYLQCIALVQAHGLDRVAFDGIGQRHRPAGAQRVTVQRGVIGAGIHDKQRLCHAYKATVPGATRRDLRIHVKALIVSFCCQATHLSGWRNGRRAVFRWQ